MSALPNSFQIQRERSKAYEIAVSRWLQAQRRYFVLPSYDYSGLADNKAPRLVRNTEWLVLPDLLGWNEQIGAWFEVKLKERADLYRKTNTLGDGHCYPSPSGLPPRQAAYAHGCLVSLHSRE